MIRMLRLKEVQLAFGYKSHVSIYNRIKDGLMTQHVPFGKQSVRWPDFEIDAINKAHIAGQSEDQIRTLVQSLHTKRASVFH